MKVLLIVAQQGFQDKEYADTKAELEKEQIIVHVASLKKGKATGKMGSTITIQYEIDEIYPEDYHAVIIIGGPGALILGNSIQFNSLIKKFTQLKKVVAAICIAPVLLAKAGLLYLKRATVWNEDGMQASILSREGAVFVNHTVVTDGTIITANGPLAAKEFGQAIASALKKN